MLSSPVCLLQNVCSGNQPSHFTDVVARTEDYTSGAGLKSLSLPCYSVGSGGGTSLQPAALQAEMGLGLHKQIGLKGEVKGL